LDGAGNLYIDEASSMLRVIDTGGNIYAFAGAAGYGFSGDGGLAVSAQTAGTQGVVTDGAGRVYFNDFGNNRIRKVEGGIISTVAGDGSPGAPVDGALAVNTSLAGVSSLSVDGWGNLYFVSNTGFTRWTRVGSCGRSPSAEPPATPATGTRAGGPDL